VSIDGKARGTTPLSLRVSAGKHEIVVEKEGFERIVHSEDVHGGARTAVQLQLNRVAQTGRLSVREHDGRAVRVFLDGKDVGEAPWEGEVDPGAHTIVLRGAGVSASKTIDAQRGQRIEVDLTATAEEGSVQITTSDGQGEISIDGKKVGTGSFRGNLSTGKHDVVVTRAGFVTDRETIEVKRGESLTKTVALVREGASAKDVSIDEPYTGVFGGFQFFGAFAPGGTGSILENNCSLFGATTCSSPVPAGMGLGGSFGYTWDPVGLELFGAGMVDYTEPSANFDGIIRPGSNAALTGPARVENWRILRYGGMGSIRVRATYESRIFRATLAVGPGFSVRSLVADRRTRTTDGATDTFAPNQVVYASAALSVEAAVHLRASRRVAFSVGVIFWFEGAGNISIKGDPDRNILTSQGPMPLRTPDYQLISGTQSYIGPFLGMVFGP
jgi:hypothetical protein